MSEDQESTLNDLLSAYLDGELSAQTRAEVQAHLDRDAQARALLADLRETRSLLQDLPRASVPAGFVDEVLNAAGQRSAPGQVTGPRRWRLGPWRAAAAITLMVGAAGTWIFWQSQAVETRLAHSTAPASPPGSAARMDHATVDPAAVESEEHEVYADARKRGMKRGVEPLVSGKKGGRVEMESPAKGAADNEGLPRRFAEAPATMRTAPKNAAPGNLGQVAEVPQPKQQLQVLEEAGERRVSPDVAMLDGAERITAAQERSAAVAPRQEPGSDLLEHMHGYRYRDQAVELVLDFPDADRRDAFHKWTTSYFSANELQEVNDLDLQGRSSLLSEGKLYMPGYGGVGFEAQGGIQTVVNAPPEVIGGLIDQYAATVQDWDGRPTVELTFGQTKASGVETTKELATLLTQAQLQQVVMNTPAEALGDFDVTAGGYVLDTLQVGGDGSRDVLKAATAEQASDEDEVSSFAGLEISAEPLAPAETKQEESQVRVAQKTSSRGAEGQSKESADREVADVEVAIDTVDHGQIRVVEGDWKKDRRQRRVAKRARRKSSQPDDAAAARGGLGAAGSGGRAGDRNISGRQVLQPARNITFVLNLRIPMVAAKRAPASTYQAPAPAARPAGDPNDSVDVEE